MCSNGQWEIEQLLGSWITSKLWQGWNWEFYPGKVYPFFPLLSSWFFIFHYVGCKDIYICLLPLCKFYFTDPKKIFRYEEKRWVPRDTPTKSHPLPREENRDKKVPDSRTRPGDRVVHRPSNTTDQFPTEKIKITPPKSNHFVSAAPSMSDQVNM